jgi:cytochrome c556
MKQIKKVAALTVLLSFCFFVSSSLADSEGIIKYRKNVMKSSGGHMGAIADILKNDLPLQAHILDHARSIQQNSKMTLAMFPKGTGLGNTKAKSAIWGNWSKFESAVQDFERESVKLAKVAESGDIEALAKQVRATGKTCGGCHRNFRKRD